MSGCLSLSINVTLYNNDPLPTSCTLTHFSSLQGFSPERLPASCCHSAPDFHVSSPAKSFFKKAAAALFGGRRDKVKYYETLSEYYNQPPIYQCTSLVFFTLQNCGRYKRHLWILHVSHSVPYCSDVSLFSCGLKRPCSDFCVLSSLPFIDKLTKEEEEIYKLQHDLERTTISQQQSKKISEVSCFYSTGNRISVVYVMLQVQYS